jgi:hypothetical protein
MRGESGAGSSSLLIMSLLGFKFKSINKIKGVNNFINLFDIIIYFLIIKDETLPKQRGGWGPHYITM